MRPVGALDREGKRASRAQRAQLQGRIEIHEPLPRPGLPRIHQASTNRIVPYVRPFFGIGFLASQEVVEESPLPQRGGDLQVGADAFGGPFFPFIHELRKRAQGAGRLFGAKEMHVIGHDDVTTDEPPVASFRQLPFAKEDVCCLRRGEDRLAFARACGDEIHRMGHPYAVQAMQMLVG